MALRARGVVGRIGLHPGQLVFIALARGAMINLGQQRRLNGQFIDDSLATPPQLRAERHRLPAGVVDVHALQPAGRRSASTTVLSSSVRAQTRSEARKAANCSLPRASPSISTPKVSSG